MGGLEDRMDVNLSSQGGGMGVEIGGGGIRGGRDMVYDGIYLEEAV